MSGRGSQVQQQHRTSSGVISVTANGNANTSGGHPSILKGSSKASGSVDHSSSDFTGFNLLTMAAESSGGFHDMSSRSSMSGTPAKRRKQDPKTGKGLRHFSMKVSYSLDERMSVFSLL
jgi:hypothetical protein